MVVVNDAVDTQLDSVTLIQKTESMLIFENIEIEYTTEDEDTEKEDFNAQDDTNFDLSELVLPGREMTITIEIENLFNDNYKSRYSDIEDINLKIDADDNDVFGSDFEDEYDFDELEAEDNDKLTFSFMVDDEVDDGDYTLELTLEGTDGKNIDYELTKEITFEIERAEEDVRVEELKIIPDEVNMCSEDFYIYLKVKNYGSRDQDEVAISLFGNDLNLNINEVDINLDDYEDDDNTWSKEYLVSLDGVTPGAFDIDANVYINDDEKEDFERLRVNILSCDDASEVQDNVDDSNSEESSSTSDSNDELASQDEDGNSEPVSSSNVINTTEGSYDKYDYMLVIMIVGIILIIAMIALFVMILIKK
jgi:hypothetical protein